MIIAAGISAKLNYIPGSDVDRLVALLENFSLPVQSPGMSEEIFEVIKSDKKRAGNKISLVLIDRIGNAVIKDVQYDDLKKWTHDLC
jgi:3-dehydroquinate synthetase